MRNEIEWLEDALSTKDATPAMTYYMVKNKMMLATNGRMVAGFPCDVDGEFLVPGEELTKILKRLPNEPTFKVNGDRLTMRSGRFSGTLHLLPAEEWRFPVLEEVVWQPFPPTLLPIFKDLRPFISESAVHRWSLGIAIDDGWCFGTNNFALAGAPFPPGGGVKALIPTWVVDFILGRTEGLVQWAMSPQFMAFKWSNGAWMRSTLIDAEFPERARAMIQAAPIGTQMVTPEYRHALTRIAELSDTDSGIHIYADRVEGKTARSVVSETMDSEIPVNSPFSIWGVKYIVPVIAAANNWSPSLWPAAVPFTGARIRGYIMGRTG
jgi:hypothetical protein